MNEVRPFKEYKEMIQGMTKEEMVKGLYDLSKNNIEKDKEIERLNNDFGEMTKLFAKEKEKNRQAIEYIEYYFAKGRTKNHKQFDLSLYEILTGKNLFNLTMKEIEQFFKGVDKK